MSGGIGLVQPIKSREQLRLTALGIIAEPFPPGAIQGQTALTSGTAQYVTVGLFAGDLITNIYVKISANGTGETLFRAGIRDTSGNSLASTADVKSSVESGSTGRIQALALSSAYTVPADGAYYLGVLSVGGTAPTLGRGVSLAVSTYSATAVFPHGQEGSQTDWDSTATVVATSNAYWIAAG